MSESHLSRSWQFQVRAVVGTCLVLPCAVVSVLSLPAAVEASWLHLQLQCAAWLLFAAGVSLRFWATMYIGGRRSREVVCEGPYSVCRNPLYWGNLLILVSAAAFFESWLLLAAAALIACFYAAATVPAEERYLTDRLGTPYMEYCRRVPRFWPRFSLFRSSARVSVKVRVLKAEFCRLIIWLWLPVVAELFHHLRGQAWWPLVRLFP